MSYPCKIICPECGSTYSHQYKYEIWDRDEDKDETYIVVNGKCQPDAGSKKEFDIKQSRNPSKRRGGIIIHLWCEGCGKIFTVSIYQEKGETFMKAITECEDK